MNDLTPTFERESGLVILEGIPLRSTRSLANPYAGV